MREIYACTMGVISWIYWKIGDGCMTDFFHDAWLSDLSLSRWPIFVSSEAGESIQIFDLIQFKGGG